MSGYHQFPAVVELAVVPAQEGDIPRVPGPRGTPLADRARATAARIGRASLEVRDALWAVLDAVSGLERTVEWLQVSLALRTQGTELQPQLVLIGADGIELQRPGPWSEGQFVHVYVMLDVRDVQQLLAVQATVEQRETGAYLAFRELRDDERDLIVAFVFQQEAKERRRALDTPG